jgi:hypothetical protein
MWGVTPPTFLKAFPGPQGWPDLKNAPQKPGQAALRYPVRVCVPVAVFLSTETFLYLSDRRFGLPGLLLAAQSPNLLTRCSFRFCYVLISDASDLRI